MPAGMQLLLLVAALAVMVSLNRAWYCCCVGFCRQQQIGTIQKLERCVSNVAGNSKPSTSTLNAACAKALGCCAESIQQNAKEMA